MAEDEKAWTDLVHELAKRPVSDRDSSYKRELHAAGNDESRNVEAESNHKERFNRMLGAAVRQPKSSD